MAHEQGIVIKTREDGWAEVLTERTDACAGCGASHCCVSYAQGAKVVTRAHNKAGARKGDLVTLTLRSALVVQSAALVYLVPIVGFVIGAGLGASIHININMSESGAAILFGFGGLVAGYLITLVISKWMGAKGKLIPVITSIVTRDYETQATIAVDPVCNMVVDPATAAATLVHRQTTYYFCSLGCKEAFEREPDRYQRT
ncbi:MAG: SoxR reducing system RseC family protein [Deltaproteobacteria bacterium]|nr:SoxR reducing system RseC family protein [Deltaproteobacteria bacterium]MBW1928644.1 SoxR reducing system RseC family protein [Deltaproteobacteria bacterium]MBW2026831.1 SoxR reducing system RseC family protein [Deltaproteobacteria bacterium]MBW2126847.1 SoxR reducing system RseC family protein [Deltaproteobacteria bacterium]